MTYRSPTHAITDSPGGNYPAYSIATIRLANPIDLSSSDTPVLKFYHKYYVNTDDAFCYVQISEDGGFSWLQLARYTGYTSTLYPEQIDLSNYKTSPILIQFRLRDNGTTPSFDGWYIDDVEIVDLGCPGRPIIDSFTAVPAFGPPPLRVLFDCPAHDSDGSIVEYRWDFDGDNVIDKTTATDTISFIYGSLGTFQAYCTVVDDSNCITRAGPLTTTVIPGRIVSIPDRSASPGTSIDIPIQISDATGLAGVGLKITFDSAWLSAENVQKGALTNTFTLADTISPGKVAISMARATGLPAGAGDLAVITFRVDTNAVDGDTTSLVLATVSLFDQNTDSISVDTKNGLFTVIGDVDIVAIKISPSDTITVNINDTETFTSTGFTATNDSVTVTPDWTVVNRMGAIGTVSPTTGTSTKFTATGPGDGLIIATFVTTKGTLVDSVVVVVGETRGDINLDGKINVQDAILCLQIIVGTFNPTPYQLWAADCDSNGKVDIPDAMCILIKSLDGLLPKFLAHSTSGPAHVGLGNFSHESNGLIPVTILIKGRDDVYGAGFEISYDPKLFSIVEVSPAMTSVLIAKNLQ